MFSGQDAIERREPSGLSGNVVVELTPEQSSTLTALWRRTGPLMMAMWTGDTRSERWFRHPY